MEQKTRQIHTRFTIGAQTNQMWRVQQLYTSCAPRNIACIWIWHEAKVKLHEQSIRTSKKKNNEYTHTFKNLEMRMRNNSLMYFLCSFCCCCCCCCCCVCVCCALCTPRTHRVFVVSRIIMLILFFYVKMRDLKRERERLACVLCLEVQKLHKKKQQQQQKQQYYSTKRAACVHFESSKFM